MTEVMLVENSNKKEEKFSSIIQYMRVMFT